ASYSRLRSRRCFTSARLCGQQHFWGHQMVGELSDDPVVQRIRASLFAIYGDRIERLILFGSRARGDAHADSDYDVAVFLVDLTDGWNEFYRMADLRIDILAATGAV